MDYTARADRATIEKTIEALNGRSNMEGQYLETKEEALDKIRELVPKGASVMNGSSRTLEEIGYIEHLKSGQHGWNNLHEAILKEADPAKQAQLRKESAFSDFYLGSVHALVETGEFVIASATGSQLPHAVFTSQNLIFVVGAQKIVPTLAQALDRLESYVYPLEDARMKSVGYPGSMLAKVLLFKNEHPMMGRKIRVLVVGQQLGF